MPDDGVRRELIDGVLHVPPARSPVHQFLGAALVMSLDVSCPNTMAVTQAVEVRLNARRSFIPDAVVLNAEAARRAPGPFVPHEVILAIEIVSPMSQAMDRVTKPALFAKAGIPSYWRIETDGAISVDTYRIDPADEVYLPFGTTPNRSTPASRGPSHCRFRG